MLLSILFLCFILFTAAIDITMIAKSYDRGDKKPPMIFTIAFALKLPFLIGIGVQYVS